MEERLPHRQTNPIRENPINKLDEQEHNQKSEAPGPGSWLAGPPSLAVPLIEPEPGAE